MQNASRTPIVDPSSLETVADLRAALEAANRKLALREIELATQRSVADELGTALGLVLGPFLSGDYTRCYDAINAIVERHLVLTQSGQPSITH